MEISWLDGLTAAVVNDPKPVPEPNPPELDAPNPGDDAWPKAELEVLPKADEEPKADDCPNGDWPNAEEVADGCAKAEEAWPNAEEGDEEACPNEDCPKADCCCVWVPNAELC